ncbi:beta-class carbonic anhydrase [Desnuesiella massiliensis]|uniref:beta-class carbonic anhydrase n=1 Tax=Desnuesiella massiliensis TaxID=1650662 RepID=UPI0006E382FA
MKRLDEILSYNKQFVKDKRYEKYRSTSNPNKKLVILSCMDTRLTELLPKAMNIKNGDAKIVKNAGATIMHPFGSIIRSIIVAIYEFNAEDVIVVGHHGCGMSNLDTNSIMNKIVNRGVTEETIATLYNSGIDVAKWLHGFESVEESIKESVKVIKNHPLIPKDVNIHGLIIDPYTGSLEVVVNGYEP